ncbi:MAG TPA: hypothetical protein VFX89_22040 [Gammaproteobacteria bacterium]|nr:hypothetical protein [Gammaproteobacteria bacterium]
MSRVSVVRLALPALACLATIAFGQDTDKTVSSSSLKCGSTASRTSRPCDERDQEVVRFEKESTTTLTLPTAKSTSCEASIQVQFSQRNTVAQLRGTLENRTCAASTGEYSVGVRIKDANGEIKTLEFREQWQRTDDQPVSIAGDYPIGENVDLVSVRTRSLRCSCTATP